MIKLAKNIKLKISNLFIDNIVCFIEKIINKWWGIIILIALPVFILDSFILLGRRVYFDIDFFNIAYPLFVFFKNAILSGESFLWNPCNFSGFPSFVSLGNFFSPINHLFFYFFPALTAYNWLTFLNYVLGGVFTAWLLKKFKLSNSAAVIGGLVYVLSQWRILRLIAISNSLPILPLLFILLWQIKAKKDWRIILLGGLVIGYSWLTVHYNWLVEILFASLFFSIFLAFYQSKNSWREYFRVPLAFFGMNLIGLVIGLVQLVPLMVFTSLSGRVGGLSYYEAAINTIWLGDLVRYFLPYFHHILITNYPEPLYLGVLPLFFVLFALASKHKLVRFFSFLFILTLLISIKHSPIFWLMHKLPVLEYFRGQTRWMFIGSFAAGILAGFGLQRFYEEGKTVWKTILLKFFKWALIIISCVSFISKIVFLFFADKLLNILKIFFKQYIYAQKARSFPIEHYYEFIDNAFWSVKPLFDPLNIKFLFPFLFLAAGYFFLRYFYNKAKNYNYFSFLALLIIVLNFIFVLWYFLPTIPKKVFARTPETVDFLKNRPGRVFTFLPLRSEYKELVNPYFPENEASFIYNSEILWPNNNILYGLESADYYDPLSTLHMSRVLSFIGSEYTSGFFEGRFTDNQLINEEISPEEKIKIFQERKKILNLLGIRYIISGYQLNEDVFSKVFETKVPPHNIPLYIFENKDARNLFYFATRVEFVNSSYEKAFNKLKNEPLANNDIFVNCDQNCPADIKVDGKGEVNLIKKENGFIHITAKINSPQWLIFSQNNLPGWKCFIDDQEVKIYEANTVYMAIAVPAGHHKIVFNYFFPFDDFLNKYFK
ncbi:MAG: YfhO family protein [bacterium]